MRMNIIIRLRSEKAMMPSTFTSLLNQLGISEIYVDSNAIFM